MLTGTGYLNPVSDSILGRLDDFVIGMLCCYVCISNRFKFICQSNALFFMLAGVAVGIAACLIWDSVILDRASASLTPYTNILLNGAFFLVVVALYRSQNYFKRLLENWLLMVLGMMCYSLYVWHSMVLLSFMRPLRDIAMFNDDGADWTGAILRTPGARVSWRYCGCALLAQLLVPPNGALLVLPHLGWGRIGCF